MTSRSLSPRPWLDANLDSLLLGMAVAAGIVAMMLLARWFGGRLNASDPQCSAWRGVIGRVLAKTSVIFMVVTAIDIVLSYADPPSRVARIGEVAFTIVAAFQAAVWARELMLGVIAQRVRDDRETTLGNAIAIIRVLINVTLFALAVIVILDNLGVNVTALVAGLGIGGIAIGLAAQGIFSDLFAALAILFDRPFRRGDLIRYGETTGTVERIGLKTTRLRATSGEQVIMANTKLLEREIHNLAEAATRRVTVPIGVDLSTSPDQLERIPVIGCESAAAQPGCRAIRCVLAAIGAPGLKFELLYEDRSSDAEQVARNRSAILMKIVAGLSRAEVKFANV